MADRNYGVNIGGGTPQSVLEQVGATGRTVNVTVTYDAAGANKTNVLNALRAIMLYIGQDNYPPV